MRRFMVMIRDGRSVAFFEYALITLFIVAAGITAWSAWTDRGAPAEAARSA